MNARRWTVTLALGLILGLAAAGCADDVGPAGPSSFAPGTEGGAPWDETDTSEGSEAATNPDGSAPQTDSRAGQGGDPDAGEGGDPDAGEGGGPKGDTGGQTGPGDGGGEEGGGNPDCSVDADCDDGNPCTANLCAQSGCANPFAQGACDDGDPCTFDTTCVEGKCAGRPVDCDDDDPCTKDSCDASGQCQHAWVTDDPACAPKILVTYPPRGAVLYGNTQVPVQGVVEAGSTPITQVRLNGQPITLSAQGAFSTSVAATYGLNILTLEADSASGASDKRVQAFSYSDTVVPVATPMDGATLPNAAGLWLGAPVFHNNNGQLDDLSSLAKLVLETLDLNEFIPSPLITSESGQASFLGCAWDVYVPFVSYSVGPVKIVPITGGLELTGTLTNFTAQVDAIEEAFLCPNLYGQATADAIQIYVRMSVDVVANVLTVDVTDVDVTFVGVDLTYTGGIALLVNFILGFFEANLAAIIENQLADWLPVYLVPLVNDLLGELVNYDLQVEVPSFVATGKPVLIDFFAEPSGSAFNPQGGAIAMNLGAATEKAIALDAPGSFARGQCGGAGPAPPPAPPAAKSCAGKCGSSSTDGTCWCDGECIAFGDCCADACTACAQCAPNLDIFPWSQIAALEAVAHEDLANQILFALWWGGGMNLLLTDTELSQFRTTAGLSGVVLELSPAMAPIATTCTPGAHLELQLGDVFIDTSFEFSNLPVKLQAWASARVRVALVVEPPQSGPVNAFGLEFVSLEDFDYQVVEVEGLGPGGKAIIDALLGEELISFIVEEYLAGAVGAFPLPAIDMGNLVPGVPQGSYIYLNPTKLALKSGFVEISGKIEPMQ